MALRGGSAVCSGVHPHTSCRGLDDGHPVCRTRASRRWVCLLDRERGSRTDCPPPALTWHRGPDAVSGFPLFTKPEDGAHLAAGGRPGLPQPRWSAFFVHCPVLGDDRPTASSLRHRYRIHTTSSHWFSCPPETSDSAAAHVPHPWWCFTSQWKSQKRAIKGHVSDGTLVWQMRITSSDSGRSRCSAERKWKESELRTWKGGPVCPTQFWGSEAPTRHHHFGRQWARLPAVSRLRCRRGPHLERG